MTILFISGFLLGAICGVLAMCLLQVNHDKEEQ